ncbi:MULTISPECIES: ABC transporter permease [unclassified Streptomyces]|uniref:ABC transporter permease n=1 Tax=unclassified Streptomyces TaxID=2593676 RepID=UPI0022523D95|nr:MULTISPECIES: ABC transporter permease [unclassified Streptomyces]MCX4797513.1 ABC transporter permease [Streptomyces sp. NBC_01242]WSP65115.1 ABC transporter permease [Streptomyces sp. NBC_01240]
MFTPHVPNGLARAAVRFKPASFAGTFVALLLAAAIVSACGILLETGLRASVPAERYAKAPVVVAADQLVHMTVGSGEGAYDAATPVPDTARLPATLAAKAAAAPGAAAAIGDVGYPVRQDGTPLTAHGWGSTALTGTRLLTGEAPRAGEVVVPAGTEHRTGENITLDTPVGMREFRVAGTTATDATVWFADRQALQLSGHPGRIDAIAVLATPGTATDALADQVRKAVGHTAHTQVHTGDGRGAVEDAGLAGAQEVLVGLGGSFGGVAAMVAVFTAAGTVALSVGQRSREFALLRAIGATPRQLRRTIATESLLIAPLAGALGTLPGIALAHWWFGQLQDKGAIPGPVDLHVSWLPLTIATATTMLTALSAGYFAARRPSKIKPGLALAQSAVERPPYGWIRTPLGIAALIGGGLFAGVAASTSGDDAANAALGVVMFFMIAVGLLGPLIARICAAVIGLPLRVAGASGSLAAANSLTNSRRLASAITPIVLAMAFSSTLVFMHTSEDRVIAHQLRDAVTADHIVSAPAGLASDATARAAATPGVSTAVGLLRGSVLVPTGSGGDRILQNTSAQGVIGSGADLAKVQDLDVRTGSLTGLRPGTVAIDTTLAGSTKRATGDRLTLRLPDGTEASPKIVAVYGRGLGTSLVTLPATDLQTHVTSPYASDVLVRATPAAAQELAALGTVTDRSGYAAARDQDREINAWANTVMAAVLGGFAAVAAANTLVMTVLDRRRELTMLRLVGSTRRQVMDMIRWEALLVTVAGAALGTAIALATLFPMMKGLTGESPYIPPALYGSFVAATIGLGLAAATVPARAALRRTAARP